MNKIKNILEKLNTIVSKTPLIIKSFNTTEKVIFYLTLTIFLISSGILYNKINTKYSVEIPTAGGSLVEGIIGVPRFINPILASSNADKDLCTLIYSGLLKATPNGKLVPDLAESYEISKDGKTYTFKLKENLIFQDGKPLTTEDIEFTIKATQDEIIKSSKRANWDSVEIKRLNDKEIQFILKQAYAPFLENLTLGILPKHLWGNITSEQFAFSQYNVNPIGSGPYKIDKIKKSADGTTEKYELKSFSGYAHPQAYISKLIIKFYSNEDSLIDAYSKKLIESLNSISPKNINKLTFQKDSEILSTPLPRIFGLFLNQDENPIFTNLEVRKALDKAINKDQLINQVFDTYGVSIDSPIPSNSIYYLPTQTEEKGLAVAENILKEGGWTKNENGVYQKITKKNSQILSFSISTSNIPELKEMAELLKTRWEEMGAKVQLKIFEIGDLNQNVIRPRKYDSLLFGEVIGRDMDLFAFWHSSQRNDPGLNISLYANITTDNLLEKIRITSDVEEKKTYFKDFQEEIREDKPAIFIYSPDFIYITTKKIKNNIINQITIPSDRFLDVSNWYIKTDKVWKIFSNL
ncbi:MAG: ABC transporter substrate-binding protein [Patescibacteria group bacterium]